MLSISKTLFLAFIICFILIDAGKPKKSKQVTESKIDKLKPRSISNKYDKDVVAFDLSKYCLDGEDPDSVLLEILQLYPCLSVTRIHKNEAFRKHGDIYRTYLYINKNENNNSNCLQDGPIIDYDEYCIEDISYDIHLDLHQYTCNTQSTNNIYYGNTKKPIAWHLNHINNNNNLNQYCYINSSNLLSSPLSNNNLIDIWILDSGINGLHKEFYNGQIIDEDKNFNYSMTHGTGTAAIASGLNYGTSKLFQIHDYPVCRTSSSCAFSYVDLGIQTVLNYMKTTGKRSVINLSLGTSGANIYTSTSTYFDNLFQDVINAGGIIVVSAGNNNADACNYFFSYSNHVISVGAHDSTKSRSSFSNYGECVDIYAPGSSIPTAYSLIDHNYITYVSGTSFSSPMIAGLIANYLYQDNSLTKDQIVAKLRSNVYPISNCPSGYCNGTYYKCQF